jgi:SAM-dependent methyltransferase
VSGAGASINQLAPSVLARVLGPPLRAFGSPDTAFLARLSRSHADGVLALEDSTWNRFIDEHRLGGRGSVLDVGCGPGAWLPELARVNERVVAIDISEELLEIARQHTNGLQNVEILTLPAENLGLPSESFDAVACLTALPYLDAPAAVGELVRVLRPGGTLVLGTVGTGYYAKHIVEGIRQDRRDAIRYGLDPLLAGAIRALSFGRRARTSLRCWSPRSVRRLLERTGFDVERVLLETAPVDPSWPARYLALPVYFTVTARRRVCGAS